MVLFGVSSKETTSADNVRLQLRDKPEIYARTKLQDTNRTQDHGQCKTDTTIRLLTGPDRFKAHCKNHGPHRREHYYIFSEVLKTSRWTVAKNMVPKKFFTLQQNGECISELHIV